MNRYVFIVIFASFSICGISDGRSDYRIPLPNGFELVRSNPWQHNICKKNGVVVVPHDITEYAVVEQFVIGRLQIPSDSRFQSGAKDGYFLVNTNKNMVSFASNESEFKNLLKNNSIYHAIQFVPVER